MVRWLWIGCYAALSWGVSKRPEHKCWYACRGYDRRRVADDCSQNSRTTCMTTLPVGPSMPCPPRPVHVNRRWRCLTTVPTQDWRRRYDDRVSSRLSDGKYRRTGHVRAAPKSSENWHVDFPTVDGKTDFPARACAYACMSAWVSSTSTR